MKLYRFHFPEERSDHAVGQSLAEQSPKYPLHADRSQNSHDVKLKSTFSPIPQWGPCVERTQLKVILALLCESTLWVAQGDMLNSFGGVLSLWNGLESLPALSETSLRGLMVWYSKYSLDTPFRNACWHSQADAKKPQCKNSLDVQKSWLSCNLPLT